MDRRGPHAEDRRGQNGGCAEPIAATDGHQPQNADQQVGEAHLQLEGAAGGPSYPLSDYIGQEKVSKSATNPVGADAAINVPIIGLEACGTSWEKDIANLKLLISTSDGGVADIKPIACLEVAGNSYEAEVSSLYTNMHKACQIASNDMMLEGHVKKQLNAYLPTISGARMMKDYLKFLFPKQ